MFSRISTPKSTETYWEKIERLKNLIGNADAVVIGAGDDTFVQDKGWYTAAERYEDFLRRRQGREDAVFGAWRRGQHAGHHQVSVLAVHQ